MAKQLLIKWNKFMAQWSLIGCFVVVLLAMHETVFAQVTPPVPAAQPSAATSPVKAPAPSVAAPETAGISPGDQKNKELEEAAELGWRGSIIFSPENIERLRKALALYQPNTPATVASNELGDDFLGEVINKNKNTQEVERHYPTFYLGSIIYSSTGEWFVWINGKKILASGTPSEERLLVKDISKAQATFEWRPTSLTDVIAGWNRRKQAQKLGRNIKGDVSFDEGAGVITFTLKPNQTFFSKTMEIIEGKISPADTLMTNIPDSPVTEVSNPKAEPEKSPLSPTIP